MFCVSPGDVGSAFTLPVKFRQQIKQHVPDHPDSWIDIPPSSTRFLGKSKIGSVCESAQPAREECAATAQNQP